MNAQEELLDSSGQRDIFLLQKSPGFQLERPVDHTAYGSHLPRKSSREKKQVRLLTDESSCWARRSTDQTVQSRSKPTRQRKGRVSYRKEGQATEKQGSLSPSKDSSPEWVVIEDGEVQLPSERGQQAHEAAEPSVTDVQPTNLDPAPGSAEGEPVTQPSYGVLVTQPGSWALVIEAREGEKGEYRRREESVLSAEEPIGMRFPEAKEGAQGAAVELPSGDGVPHEGGAGHPAEEAETSIPTWTKEATAQPEGGAAAEVAPATAVLSSMGHQCPDGASASEQTQPEGIPSLTRPPSAPSVCIRTCEGLLLNIPPQVLSERQTLRQRLHLDAFVSRILGTARQQSFIASLEEQRHLFSVEVVEAAKSKEQRKTERRRLRDEKMKELERASAEIQAGIRAQQEVFAELNATLQAVQGQATSLSQERLELQERRQAMEDHCKAVLNRIAVLEERKATERYVAEFAGLLLPPGDAQVQSTVAALPEPPAAPRFQLESTEQLLALQSLPPKACSQGGVECPTARIGPEMTAQAQPENAVQVLSQPLWAGHKAAMPPANEPAALQSPRPESVTQQWVAATTLQGPPAPLFAAAGAPTAEAGEGACAMDSEVQGEPVELDDLERDAAPMDYKESPKGAQHFWVPSAEQSQHQSRPEGASWSSWLHGMLVDAAVDRQVNNRISRTVATKCTADERATDRRRHDPGLLPAPPPYSSSNGCCVEGARRRERSRKLKLLTAAEELSRNALLSPHYIPAENEAASSEQGGVLGDSNESASEAAAKVPRISSDVVRRLPAICIHPRAVEAHLHVVSEHKRRREEAQRLTRATIYGRRLEGYASRCGALQQRDEEDRVTIGCGTALADVHYTCPHCKMPHLSELQDYNSGDEVDSSLDYCEECAAANDFRCPNPGCLSSGYSSQRLLPSDYLQNKGLRKFAACSERIASFYYRDITRPLAHAVRKQQKDALENLPDGCRQSFGTSDSMYVADPETARRHCLFENALDEGMPLLVRNAAPYFDDRVFTPEAMKDLAKEEEHQKGFVVKAQFGDKGGATVKAKYLSVEDFFEPMIIRDRELLSFRPGDWWEGDDHVGFKAPDFGIQPKEQSKAFMAGMDRLGFGDIASPHACHNLANYLASETEDPVNGTQKPDLGPKFYIARPRMQRDPLTKKTSFAGYTFTPLHCDLADAVNYCCYGEQATWTIFRRSDRDRLLHFLEKKYGKGRSGTEMLWNPTNHRLLEEEDFRELASDHQVYPWHFQQKAGEVVVIPAGCAHQVKNGGSGWNIKVAQDFVAPQSAETCLQILREMREARQEDKVQVVLTLRFAGAAAYRSREFWRDLLQPEKRGRKGEEKPSEPRERCRPFQRSSERKTRNEADWNQRTMSEDLATRRRHDDQEGARQSKRSCMRE